MAEPGYPQDHKDPSVFVDMSTDNYRDEHDDSNSAPPPPFSAHHDEDSVPLLFSDDKKQEELPLPTPAAEEKRCGWRGRRCSRTPEQRAACKTKARKIFRRIFAVGLLFFVYCAFFGSNDDNNDCAGCIFTDLDSTNYDVFVEDGSPSLMVLSTPNQGGLSAKQQADLVFAMSEDECWKDLVPWNGPATISTDVRNIKLSIGNGNIFTAVVVRSSANVNRPTFVLSANVTKNLPEDDGGDGDDDDDEDDREKEGPKGLHLELHDEEDSLEIRFWADGNLDEEDPEDPEEPPSDPTPSPTHPNPDPTHPVPSPPPHHGHRHGRKHHKKHHKKHHHGKKHHGMKHHRKHHRKHHHDDDESFWMKKRAFHSRHHRFSPQDDRRSASKGPKFCAEIGVEILLPIGYNSIDNLSINGVVLRAEIVDDLAPIFGEGIDNLEIKAIVGEISSGPVRANTLQVNVVAGKIQIENVQAATTGTAVQAFAAGVATDISLGVTTTTVDKPEDEDDGGDDDDEEEDIIKGKKGKGCSGKRGGDDDDEGGDDDDEGGDDDDEGGDDDDDEDRPPRNTLHFVKATTTVGTIHVNVTEAREDVRNKLRGVEQIPGMLVAISGTGSGDIDTSIDLINKRQLILRSESVGGKIYSRVSDKFLGSFKVTTLIGTADLIELESSPSTIDYTKNKKNAKVGRKFIVRDGDDDDDDPDNSVLGDIVLGSPFGRATLEFF